MTSTQQIAERLYTHYQHCGINPQRDVVECLPVPKPSLLTFIRVNWFYPASFVIAAGLVTLLVKLWGM